ncbi:MAG TPA: hypothetical protein VE935_04720 [Burkholderiales bacterium]|nr:hypothetical protein [Burkholderiales bacterium]
MSSSIPLERLSVALPRAPRGKASGQYSAHRDSRAYRYEAAWFVLGHKVRWEAVVIADSGLAAPCEGTIDLKQVGGGNPETWVRAAIELAIEKGL